MVEVNRWWRSGLAIASGGRQVGKDQHASRKREEVASGMEGAHGRPVTVGHSLRRKKQPRATLVLGARLWL
jgi:hypothetical protein